MQIRPGREQLREWLERRGWSQQRFADEMGWHKSYVSRLLSDEHAHARTIGTAIRIERMTGIPVEAWADNEDLDLETAGGRARLAR